MIKRGFSILIIFIHCLAFSQGASMSPYDLKEQFLEKKKSFRTSDSKYVDEKEQEQLNHIETVLEEKAPGTYEYFFVKALNANYALSAEADFLKAKSLKIDAHEINIYLFDFYCFHNNIQKQKELAPTVLSQYSPVQLNYYTQLLNTTQADAIVFSGMDDALPAFCLKAYGKITTSSSLICLEYLRFKSYRQRIATKMNVSGGTFEKQEKNALIELLLKTEKKIAVSTTVPQGYLKKIADEIYITGLVYQRTPSNQFENLNAFWEATKRDFNGLELTKRLEKQLLGNYLPPLLTLYKLKMMEGTPDQLLKQGIKLVATKVGRLEDVEKVLSSYE